MPTGIDLYVPYRDTAHAPQGTCPSRPHVPITHSAVSRGTPSALPTRAPQPRRGPLPGEMQGHLLAVLKLQHRTQHLKIFPTHTTHSCGCSLEQGRSPAEPGQSQGVAQGRARRSCHPQPGPGDPTAGPYPLLSPSHPAPRRSLHPPVPGAQQ